MEPFAELICAYLDGLPGAADILNDALEEVGRERVASDGTDGERLTIVLEQLINDRVARRVALDFARHVVGHTTGNGEKLIEQKRELITESETSDSPISPSLAELQDDYTTLNRLGWSEEVTPQTSAAWAVWGALIIPVQNVALAAQRTIQTELRWQIEHMQKILRGGS